MFRVMAAGLSSSGRLRNSIRAETCPSSPRALTTPHGLAFDSSGNLYVANQINGTIEKFDSSRNGTIFASGLDHPEGLAFDSSGNLYVADWGSIDKFDSGGNMSTFASGLDYPEGLAFDSSGNLYVADGGSIDKFDSGGNMSIFASGLYEPTFIATQVPEPATLLLLGLGAVVLRKMK